MVLSPPVLVGSAGVLAGQVQLQGRSNHGGATISAETYFVESDDLGKFEIGIEEGYTLIVSKPGYLNVQVRGADVGAGETVDLEQIRLPAGDLTGDQKIDILDLVAVVTTLGQPRPDTDLNLDGIVDIRDLTLAASNYGRRGPIVVTNLP